MRFAAAALAALLGAGCAGGPVSGWDEQAEARRVLERGIEAQGGRAAIEAVETLREVARVTYRGNDLSVTTWLGRPDKLRQIIVRGTTEQHSILDGERAWAVITSGAQAPVVSELGPPGVAKLRELRKNWVPALGAEAESLSYSEPGVRPDLAQEAITATDARGRSRVLTFSTRTGLLARITAGSGDTQVHYDYRDYRLVRSLGGAAVQWPHAIDVRVGDQVTKRIRTVTIELDPELPPKAFRP
ncbi:MAG: hypothetical protein ACYTGX_03715 [Planctomycetota bacterium]